MILSDVARISAKGGETNAALQSGGQRREAESWVSRCDPPGVL
jgi:hypothetical protein